MSVGRGHLSVCVLMPFQKKGDGKLTYCRNLKRGQFPSELDKISIQCLKGQCRYRNQHYEISYSASVQRYGRGQMGFREREGGQL